ncbi:MAG: hypothetical protein ACRESV_03040 [Nevskiales bacterium]
MSDRQSVAANTTTGNVLAGKTAEFISEPSIVQLYALAAAVGVFITLIIGDEIVVEDQEIASAAGFPIIPDHFVAEGGGFPQDRVILKYRNSTGAAIVVQSRVQVEPA